MSYQVEDLGKSMQKLTITCSAEDFDAAIVKAYQKNKGKINIPGFRKGKAPQSMIEKMYGASIFYEDAANALIPGAYEEAAKECGLEIVSRPEIDVVKINKGEEFVFTATVAVKPEVTLGEYKGVEVDAVEVSVTDEEVQMELDRQVKMNARKNKADADATVENGDEIKLDFEGYMDGVAFEGGKGEDYDLTVGNGAFIPGFEEQLVGKKAGEEFDVNVTFPEDYQASNLAGQPAVFKCTVKEITKVSFDELNDTFAQEVGGFDTLDEYKADVKKNLLEGKQKSADEAKKDAAVDKAAENATIEIPQPMIEAQKENMAEEFNYRLQSQGLSLDQYLMYMGMDAKTYIDSLTPQAEKRIRTRLVLEAIAAAEGIEATEDDFNAEIENMAKMYNMEADKVKEILGAQADDIKMDLVCRKAADLIADNAKTAKKKAAKKTTKKAEAAEDAAEEKPAKKTTRKSAKKEEAAE